MPKKFLTKLLSLYKCYLVPQNASLSFKNGFLSFETVFPELKYVQMK